MTLRNPIHTRYFLGLFSLFSRAIWLFRRGLAEPGSICASCSSWVEQHDAEQSQEKASDGQMNGPIPRFYDIFKNSGQGLISRGVGDLAGSELVVSCSRPIGRTSSEPAGGDIGRIS